VNATDDHLGTIKVFLPEPKNFGFIIADNPSFGDVFFHASALPFRADESKLERGTRVRFVLGSPSPKGARAVSVELV
jgi:cold shock CspA family protein